MSDFAVMIAVNKGERPSRPGLAECHGFLLSDALWSLIHSCWAEEPSSRPHMRDIVKFFDALREPPAPIIHANITARDR
jgi:hypothetical protein